MPWKEQIKELSRRYLDGEITDVEYWTCMLNGMYVASDQEKKDICTWVAQQLSIIR